MRLRITLVAVLLFAARLAWPQSETPQSVDEILERFQAGGGAAETWTADMTMTMNMMGMPMTYAGQVKNKGDRSATTMNIDMMGQKVSMKMYQTGDGVMWTVMDMGGTVQVMKMDMGMMAGMTSELMGMSPGGAPGNPSSNQADLENVLDQYDSLYEMTVGQPTEFDGVAVNVIRGTLNPDALETLRANPMMAPMIDQMSRVEVFVGVEDGFTRKMETTNEQGDVFMSIQYTNVVLNPEIDDAEFDYTPPEGVQVMDMTAMMQGNMEALEAGTLGQQYNTKFAIGDIAPDFESTRLDGSAFKLSDLRGKVVLIDFWATWCGPCIGELPNVVQTNDQFAESGLHIVSISLDEDSAALTEFLNEHSEITWDQVFELGGFESPTAQLYGVDAIPHTLLLDANGVIIAKDLRGPALGAAVAEALDLPDE